MGLKNYSTSINVEKTIAEIECILSIHGASDIWKQYDGAGNVVCLNFAVNTEFGKMPFRLPMDAQKVSQILMNERKVGKLSLSKRESEDIDHARRVGWRIIKDWIDWLRHVLVEKYKYIETHVNNYGFNEHNNVSYVGGG